jgi:hypothetical protein
MQSFKDGIKERAYFKHSELYHYTSMIWHIYRQNDFKCLCVYSPGLENIVVIL